VDQDRGPPADGLTRRTLLGAGAATVAVASTPVLSVDAHAEDRPAAAAPPHVTTHLRVNGTEHVLTLDPRVTLLDAMREHLKFTGSKKGCDQGQCGACTMIVNGRRINSCLTLAVIHDGDEITTIEGLGTPERLHPLQAAFVEHDGFQCGYCTPGQIMSSLAVLGEIRDGIPSHVTQDLDRIAYSELEVRERMSGNICRCAAYSNIIEAINQVHTEGNI
jgi:xanthine dehydrogenase YagT iron-sulfur-binding subunit